MAPRGCGYPTRPRAVAAIKQLVAVRRPERKVPMKRNVRAHDNESFDGKDVRPYPVEREGGESLRDVVLSFIPCVMVGFLFVL